MVSLMSLWLPILLSAVAVFIVSAIVHMVLPYHRTDYSRIAGEDDVMAALGKHNLEPGEYVFPYGGTPSAMKDPAFVEKRTRGPAGFLTIMPKGMPPMGPYLFQWFIYSLVVGLFVAYLTGRALPAGARDADVFRFAATVAFLSYGMALVHNSIWYHRRWSTTFKSLFDAALYAAATGAVFCWMWP